MYITPSHSVSQIPIHVSPHFQHICSVIFKSHIHAPKSLPRCSTRVNSWLVRGVTYVSFVSFVSLSQRSSASQSQWRRNLLKHLWRIWRRLQCLNRSRSPKSSMLSNISLGKPIVGRQKMSRLELYNQQHVSQRETGPP